MLACYGEGLLRGGEMSIVKLCPYAEDERCKYERYYGEPLFSKCKNCEIKNSCRYETKKKKKEVTMFEKEAKSHSKEWFSKNVDTNTYETPFTERYCYELGFKDGAEFGYNKANKWHYVKDGELPYTEFNRIAVTVAYLNAYDNPCKMDCCFDGTNFIYWDNRSPVGWKNVDIFGKVYAWKYQEKLPEPPKESE